MAKPTIIKVNQKLQHKLRDNMDDRHTCDTLSRACSYRKTPVTRQTISGVYHNSAKRVKIETLAKLANALRIPLSDLIEVKK
jgi:transcriptional regulator with XRE-family HTH domain